MAVNIGEVRDQVARMVANVAGKVELAPGGELSFPYETTRVYIAVEPFLEASAVVNVYAITNVDVDMTPALYEFVATRTDDWVFGHLAVKEAEGRGIVLLRHTLLADYLDEEEVRDAIVAVALTADSIDEEIKSRFGGSLASEV